jgi:hypothetical protein
MLHTSQKTVAIIVVVFLLAIGTAQASNGWMMFCHDLAYSEKDEVCEWEWGVDKND